MYLIFLKNIKTKLFSKYYNNLLKSYFYIKYKNFLVEGITKKFFAIMLKFILKTVKFIYHLKKIKDKLYKNLLKLLILGYHKKN